MLNVITGISSTLLVTLAVIALLIHFILFFALNTADRLKQVYLKVPSVATYVRYVHVWTSSF